MLGEKRNPSLFGCQPAQEEKPIRHITLDRDGEKKDIPLYFGPDWPVIDSAGNAILDGVPIPDEAETIAEETLSSGPAPQDASTGDADFTPPDLDMSYPDNPPRRTLASNAAVGNRTHALFFAPDGDS